MDIKAIIYKIRENLKSRVSQLKKISLTRWGLIIAVITGVITVGAWLFPEPINSILKPTPQPTTIAQELGLTKSVYPPKTKAIRILIARFDEENSSSYRVTDLIIAQLRSALANYPDTEIIPIPRVITEQDDDDTAAKIGIFYDADIVIWGWYGHTKDAVPLGIHFETLSISKPEHPNSCPAVNVKSRSAIRKANPIELNDLTLQTNLSNELSYVTIFTLGVIRFDAKDWKNAIEMFDTALNHLTEKIILSAKTEGNGILVDKDILYYYRGQAYLSLKNFSNALDDFHKISSTNPTSYLYIAKALAEQGKIDEAINVYSQAIISGNSNLATLAKYKRADLLEQIGKLDLANKDISSTIQENQEQVPELDVSPENQDETLNSLDAKISKNPNNPLNYYWRGIIYQQNGKNQDALKDFNKAINLLPNFYLAREARSHIFIALEMYSETIDDLNYIFQKKEFYTPCNLYNRGLSDNYINRSSDASDARKDFQTAIDLSTKIITEHPDNTHAYYVRHLAYEGLGRQNFWVRFWPFDLNRLNSLRDLITLSELESEKSLNERQGGGVVEFLDLGNSILMPYILWGVVLYSLINARKNLNTLVGFFQNRLNNKKKKRNRHMKKN